MGKKTTFSIKSIITLCALMMGCSSIAPLRSDVPVKHNVAFHVDLPQGWVNVTSSMDGTKFAAIQFDGGDATYVVVEIEGSAYLQQLCSNQTFDEDLIKLSRLSSALTYDDASATQVSIHGRPATYVELVDGTNGTITWVYACGVEKFYVATCFGGVTTDTRVPCASVVGSTYFK